METRWLEFRRKEVEEKVQAEELDKMVGEWREFRSRVEENNARKLERFSQLQPGGPDVMLFKQKPKLDRKKGVRAFKFPSQPSLKAAVSGQNVRKEQMRWLRATLQPFLHEPNEKSNTDDVDMKLGTTVPDKCVLEDMHAEDRKTCRWRFGEEI